MRIRDLREAREAPLYHWMTPEKMTAVFKKDIMPGFFEHTLPTTNQRVTGNSMTRNPRLLFAHEKRIVRLTFNQDALSRTNKIIPLDAEVTWHHKSGIGGYTPDRYKKPELVGKGIRRDVNVMAEEFVVGDIKPLHRYLIEIFIYPLDQIEQIIPRKAPKTREVLIQAAISYGEKYGIPVTHEFKTR